MTANAPSNGTMGMMWQDVWCFRCRNDHGFSHVTDANPDEGCEHLLRMMVEDGPFDFLRDEHDEGPGGWDPRKLVCQFFDRCPCQDDPGWSPPLPAPVHPDQGILFDVLPDSPVTPGGVVILHEQPAVERVNVGEYL